jgi:TIGR03009 family protein
MDQLSRTVRATLSLCLPFLLTASTASAQQLGAPQSYPQQGAYSQPAPPVAQPNVPNNGVPQPLAIPAAPAVPQVPEGFQLNALQAAELNQVLDAWQAASGKILTFSCPFDRQEYVPAFGPVVNNQLQPLNKNKGELTFSKPDKGSFEIKEIWTFKTLPTPPDKPQAPVQGDWFQQKDAVGEHWVCDGKSIYEFRSDQKQVIERQLPPRAAGEALIDGPLPFLFGAESAKLKQRYWMKIDNQNTDANQVRLTALPKHQEQAANFRRVDVILDRRMQLPTAMQVTMPNSDRHVYVFHIEQAKINNTLDRIQQAVFEKPHTPWGWKHVVDNMPMAQTPQPTTKPQTK